MALSRISEEPGHLTTIEAWSDDFAAQSNGYDSSSLIDDSEAIEGYINYNSDQYLSTEMSWITTSEHVFTVADLSTSITPLLARILSTSNPRLLSDQLLRENRIDFSFERLHRPSTWKLLLKQSVDQQLFQMIFHRLVNDSRSMEVLQEPKTGQDRLFETGVQYIFSLGAPFLITIIETVPLTYRPALEQGMFCAAVELGAAHILEAIYLRGFEVKKLFSFGKSGACYPLERSCYLHHVEATRVLLNCGADANQGSKWDTPLLSVFGSGPHQFTREAFQISQEAIQIAYLLLKNGARVGGSEAKSMFSNCPLHHHLALVDYFIDYFIDQKFKVFIKQGALVTILSRLDWDAQFLTTMRVILAQGYPEGIESCKIWQEQLKKSLYAAVLRNRSEAVGLLLSAGVQPTTRCLMAALKSSNMVIFGHFLDLGLDPNIPADWVPSGSNYGTVSIQNTVLGESIESNSTAAFKILEQRGYMSKVTDHEAGFERTLLAACKVGNEALVQHLLSVGRHMSLNWDYSGSFLTAAVNAGKMSIVKQLLVVGIVPGLDSLSLAIKKRHVVLIDLLQGVVEFDLDQSDSTDVVLEAISWGNMSMVQTLLEFGCFGHVITIDTENLGTSKSHNDNRDDIRLNLKQCPRPPHYHRYQVSPLSFAILRGGNDIVNLLLSAFTTESFAGTQGWCVTALTACVIKRDTELLEELLDRGANPFDNSAIYSAVALGRKVFAKVLIDAFMRRYPKGCALFGSAALVYAIRYEDLGMLRLLAGVADAAAITIAWASGRDDWMPSQSKRKTDQFFMDNRHRSPFGEAILMHCRSDGASEALPFLLTHVNNPDILVFK
jgi:ankyrin repeat protein